MEVIPDIYIISIILQQITASQSKETTFWLILFISVTPAARWRAVSFKEIQTNNNIILVRKIIE